MEFGDRTADLSKVTCPVLAFSGKSDALVPIRSARAALAALGSSDVRFRVVPGGHMGVVAGLRAPANVWQVTKDFLNEVIA
jgi:polyhydroxyalkanoate synthase subunit PhaC